MTRLTALWGATLVVVVLLGCGPKDTTTQPDATPSPKASGKAKLSEPAKVTAEGLTKELAENRDATKEKYPDGGVIEISGVIAETRPISYIHEEAIIVLSGVPASKPDEGKTININCGFGRDKESPAAKLVATLKPGQKVTVRGTNDGIFFTWIQLKDCVFIDPKP